ncbi:MAG: hypothetical protein Q8L26_05545 [Candidatus Omnitrophota bacterium]|nr:hypothetical protein [Candidatus Omnitrophota bacterium]
MRHSTLFKKTIALTAALCFCAHSSGLAQVLPAVNPRVNFGQPPVLKYLSVNSANPFNYFNFLLGVNPQAKENLDREAKKLINYFFLGVTLPNHTLWVNLRPDEPERIASEELAKTDMGRVLLEEDLQLKKDAAKYLHPANAKGKEFWEKLYAAIGKDNVKKMKIATSNRVWIVPDEAVVVETEDGALVASAKLKVLSENEYLKENPQDETQVVMEKLMKEIILPALTDEINSGPAYAPLRQIYHSLILAEWFKRKHKSSASVFALSINRGYTNGLESELPWAKQKIWQEYVDSYQKSEYKLQDTLFGLRRMYWSGGIVMDLAGQGTTTGFSVPGTLGTGGSVGTASPLKVVGLNDALKTPGILDKIKVDLANDSNLVVIGGTDPTFRNEMSRTELKIVSVASSMKKNLASGGQGPAIAAAAGGRAAGKKISTPEDIFTALKPVLKYKPAGLYFEDDLPGLIVLQPAFGKVLAHNFIIAKYHAGEISGGGLAFLFAHELAELENSDNASVFQNIKNTFSGLFKPEKEKIKAVKQKEHNMDWRAVELIEKEGHSIEDAVSILKRTPELFDEAEKAGLIKGRIKDRETHPSIGERIEYILSRKKQSNLFVPGSINGEGLKIKNALADFISKPLEFFPREKIYLYQMNKFISSLPVEYDPSFLDPKNDFNLKESLGEIGKNASDAVNFFYKEDYLKEKGILRPQGYAGKIEASFKIEEDNLKISFIDNGLSPEQLTADDKAKYGGLGGLGEGLSAVERSLNKVGGRLSALIKDDGRKEIVLDIPFKNLRLKNAAAGSPLANNETQSVSSGAEEILGRANRYMSVGAFKDALPLYREALDGFNKIENIEASDVYLLKLSAEGNLKTAERIVNAYSSRKIDEREIGHLTPGTTYEKRLAATHPYISSLLKDEPGNEESKPVVLDIGMGRIPATTNELAAALGGRANVIGMDRIIPQETVEIYTDMSGRPLGLGEEIVAFFDANEQFLYGYAGSDSLSPEEIENVLRRRELLIKNNVFKDENGNKRIVSPFKDYELANLKFKEGDLFNLALEEKADVVRFFNGMDYYKGRENEVLGILAKNVKEGGYILIGNKASGQGLAPLMEFMVYKNQKTDAGLKLVPVALGTEAVFSKNGMLAGGFGYENLFKPYSDFWERVRNTAQEASAEFSVNDSAFDKLVVLLDSRGYRFSKRGLNTLVFDLDSEGKVLKKDGSSLAFSPLSMDKAAGDFLNTLDYLKRQGRLSKELSMVPQVAEALKETALKALSLPGGLIQEDDREELLSAIIKDNFSGGEKVKELEAFIAKVKEKLSQAKARFGEAEYQNITSVVDDFKKLATIQNTPDEQSTAALAGENEASLNRIMPLQTYRDSGLSEADKGGIDLSKIELILKDEKYVSSLNAADVKILRATRALNQGWDSLALLHVHEIISFVKYGLIKDLTQKAAILELLSQLSQRQELDEEASRFFTVLQASQDLREVKLAFN